MDRPLNPVYSAEQVRALDRDAIERSGIPGYTLMTRAGGAALRLLRQRWPDARHITVVCGSGNNAGDGYVVARLAKREGIGATVIALFDPKSLKGDAQTAQQDFVRDGGMISPWSDACLRDADVIVDAIFGTGLSRPLDEDLQSRIAAVNRARKPILSLDVPSGIHADTGHIMGAAVKADCTITFVGRKLGLYLGVAPDFVGDLEFDALDIPSNDGAVAFSAELISEEWLRAVLPRRSRLSHKGSNGHALIIGGGTGMAGAVRLAGEGCLRVGAGLVMVATHPDNVASVVTERPELIVRPVASASELMPLLERCDVVAIGPGLGQSAWSRELLDLTLKSDKSMVVDADALNLMVARPMTKRKWILTPHPGEAARLLQSTNSAIQLDRLGAASELQNKFGGVTILKGANTLVRGESRVAICDRGNPGMATPGMGDVLTGIVCGLLAQLKDPWSAACAGAFVHASAGDLAARALGRSVERGLIASDLFAQLPSCVNFDE